MRINLKVRELEIMRHATAWSHRSPLYRNWFCPGGKDLAICERLAANGLMRKINVADGVPVFSVTESGLQRLLQVERLARLKGYQ